MHDHVIELSKSTKEEERHLITTRKEIIDYGINSLFSKDQYEKLLQPLQGHIPDYRYIVLSCKDEVKHIKSKLSKYSYSINVDCPLFKSNMYSKVLQCSGSRLLTLLAKQHLYQLIMSKPNSPNGITIVADAPECNNAMLNVKRPAVLRQYYGMNIGVESDHIIRRVAYRSMLTTSSEGSDPMKLTIKPFSPEIEEMSKLFIIF